MAEKKDEKEDKLKLSPQEWAALASSLAICLSEKYSFGDLCTLRLFFSTLSSNIALIEFHCKLCKK